MTAWNQFLSAAILVLIRLSAVVAWAPYFSAIALPARTKAIFVLLMANLLTPVIAGLPESHPTLGLAAILGEVAVGMLFGLTLALLNEMLLFAGELIGLQLSFSLVNLLDPSSTIQTPLMGELFQLLGTLVLITGGLDRILLRSFVRSFHAAPLGAFVLSPLTSAVLIRAAGGIFLAGVELAAPVLAATLLVDVAVALMGKLSPQLPAMSLTVPVKTMAGFFFLTASLALWPRFIEGHFDHLLDVAQHLIATGSSRVSS
jgi:flagellar biosynthetic protein FliR